MLRSASAVSRVIIAEVSFGPGAGTLGGARARSGADSSAAAAMLPCDIAPESTWIFASIESFILIVPLPAWRTSVPRGNLMGLVPRACLDASTFPSFLLAVPTFQSFHFPTSTLPFFPLSYSPTGPCTLHALSRAWPLTRPWRHERVPLTKCRTGESVLSATLLQFLSFLWPSGATSKFHHF